MAIDIIDGRIAVAYLKLLGEPDYYLAAFGEDRETLEYFARLNIKPHEPSIFGYSPMKGRPAMLSHERRGIVALAVLRYEFLVSWRKMAQRRDLEEDCVRVAEMAGTDTKHVSELVYQMLMLGVARTCVHIGNLPIPPRD